MTNPYYVKPPYPTPQEVQQQQPFDIGPYAQAAVGGLNFINNAAGQLGAASNINVDVPGTQVDAYNRPQYNLGGATAQINSVTPKMLGSTGGAVLGGAAQGASIGSAFGPLGAAVGGAIGGIVNGISNIFGKKRIKRKKRKLQRRLAAAQDTFNEQNLSSERSILARQAYQDQVSNPYGIPTNYY